MCKDDRFHNRLAEVRKRYNGKVYNFSISIYNGNGNNDQSFLVGGRWRETADWDTAPPVRA